MTHFLHDFSTLRRPRLLMKAARIGAAGLARAGRKRPGGLQGGLDKLVLEEEALNEKRKLGEADYSPRRHVAILMVLVLALQGAGGVV